MEREKNGKSDSRTKRERQRGKSPRKGNDSMGDMERKNDEEIPPNGIGAKIKNRRRLTPHKEKTQNSKIFPKIKRR